MADSAFKIIGRWAAGALCALAVSIVHAQPPRGHGAGFSAPRAQLWRGPSRALASAGRRSERTFVMTMDPYAHGGVRRVPTPLLAPAAPLRPVSNETRALARESGSAYLRAGSLRADIARYNEERGATRPAPSASPNRTPPPSHAPSLFSGN